MKYKKEFEEQYLNIAEKSSRITYLEFYIDFIEAKLYSIQQQLSDSEDKASTPKCSHEMIYPCDGSKPVCKKCGWCSAGSITVNTSDKLEDNDCRKCPDCGQLMKKEIHWHCNNEKCWETEKDNIVVKPNWNCKNEKQ